METLQALIIVLAIILVGWGLYYLATSAFQLYWGKPVTMRNLFKGFRQKMWMTVGLGILFFGFYFLLVLIGSYIIDHESRQYLFLLIYQHPKAFIYFGLLLFASVTICIYLCRMVIIYLYNSKYKD